jgi:hypothetical protein
LKRLIVALFALAGASCSQPEAGYPPAYELNFMRGCEAQGAPRAVCACSWARIAADVPRADLDGLERLPAAQRPESPVQQQIEGFALQCMAEHAPPAPEAP